LGTEPHGDAASRNHELSILPATTCRGHQLNIEGSEIESIDVGLCEHYRRTEHDLAAANLNRPEPASVERARPRHEALRNQERAGAHRKVTEIGGRSHTH